MILRRKLASHEFHRSNVYLKSRRFSFDLKMKTAGNILVVICVLWLQTSSGVIEAGGRLKRELRFPKGGSFAVAVALASFLPKGPTEGLAHVLEFDLGFPFPEKFVFGKKMTQKKTWHHPYKTTGIKSLYKPTKRSKRNPREDEKMNLLFKIENAITRIGFNGSACTLRFQCELSYISPKNSLLEELLFVLFKTSTEPNSSECAVHSQTCPVSLLQIIMHSEQISASQMI